MDAVPEWIFGVDFSGARDAHRLIWVARCKPDGHGLVVLDCAPVREIRGARDRGAALMSLRKLVASEPDGLFGMDFPFSVPQEMWLGGDWVTFASTFTQRWTDPVMFRKRMLELTGRKEPKRRIGEDAKTPFCSVNLRIFRQTYYGIGRVLGPLLHYSKARVLPFQRYEPGVATVIEVCPASTRGSIGIKSAGYKGRTSACADKRADVLRKLEGEFGVRISNETLRERIVSDQGGDALDSVIAARAVLSALQHGDLTTEARDDVEAVKGRVYFRL